MGFNTLTEIYAKDKVDRAVIDESIRKSVVWDSGLVAIDPKLNELVAVAEGRKIERIGWVDLADPLLTGNAVQATTHNPGYPDDSNTDIIPNANNQYSYTAVRCMANYSMGQKEIVKALGYVTDPVGELGGRTSNYWSRYFDMYGTSMLVGVFEDNLANDAGDMIYGDGTTAIDEMAILNGFKTFGDSANMGTGVMICHSNVAFALRTAQLIDTIPSAINPAVNFEYFQGIRMLVSDNVPVKSGTCITILADASAIEFGASTNNIIPSEVWRNPLAGVGGGEEQLITRQNFAMHVMGYSWLDDTVTGAVASGSIPGLDTTTELWPCPADLQLAANWNRVIARKKVRLAFLWTSETGGGITA